MAKAILNENALAPTNKMMGVYQIKNSVTNELYIGSSCDVKSRWAVHRYRLRHEYTGNSRLQEAWNKYGESCFLFSILQVVNDKADLIASEQSFIDALKPSYNVAPNAGNNFGINFSAAHRLKIGIRSSGENNPWFGKIPPCVGPKTAEQKAHMSALHSGENNPMYGITPPHAKLTDDQVREIRKELASGKSLSALASAYGVSKSNIANIKKGRAYKRVI